MRKKKYPKPHCRSPQLWMGYNPKDKNAYERFRILYPDGTSEWQINDCIDWLDNNPEKHTPCWMYNGKEFVEVIKSFKKRIQLMKEFDKEIGNVTIFLGNI